MRERSCSRYWGLKINKAIRDGRLQRITSGDPPKGTIKSERSIADSEAAMGQDCTRQSDRVAAARGQLEQADIQFNPASDVSYAGVLFALPTLLSNGLLKGTRQYFNLPQRNLRKIFILNIIKEKRNLNEIIRTY